MSEDVGVDYLVFVKISDDQDEAAIYELHEAKGLIPEIAVESVGARACSDDVIVVEKEAWYVHRFDVSSKTSYEVTRKTEED